MKTLFESVPLFSHGRLDAELVEEHLSAIREVLESGDVMPINNQYVTAFEKELAKVSRTEYAIGVGSGSISLVMALESLKLPQGSEVITTPFTFQATGAAIEHAKLKPVFADIDLKTLQISDQETLKAISSETSALLPVHLNGSLCAIEQSRKAAQERGIRIVDDSAQRLGKNPMNGLYSDAVCYSLGPTKNIVGCAEAGAIVTSNPDVEQNCRVLLRNGSVGNFYHVMLGFNAAMDPIAAVIMLNNLKHLEDWNARRREVAARYDHNLHDINEISLIERHPTTSGGKYSIYVEEGRDSLFNYLYEELHIEADIYYPTPLHLQPCFAHLGYGRGDFPNAEKAADQVLSLPIHDKLTDDEIDYISEKIRGYFGYGK